MLRVIVLVLLGGCKGCVDPDLGADDPDDTLPGDPPVTDTAPEIRDTVVVPCDLPEVEPNDAVGDATPLAMEALGCGVFQTTVDGDFWRFHLDEDAWIAVDAPAFTIGSSARLSMALTHLGTNQSVGVTHYNGVPEAHVIVPARAGDWQVFLRQHVGDQGLPGEGDDFFYELRASVTKAPLLWDLDEGANEAAGAAQLLLDAEGEVAVFGVLADAGDEDWYEVRVPSGVHVARFDVDAAGFGSPMDPTLRIEAAGQPTQTRESGVVGWDLDPFVEQQVDSATIYKLRVMDDQARSGAMMWYVLRVTVEAGGG